MAPQALHRQIEKSGTGQSSHQVHDEDVTAAAMDFLNRVGVRKRSGQQGEPFCLHVGYMLPHSPYVARESDFEIYRGEMAMPRNPGATDDRSHPFFQWWRDRNGFLDVKETDALRARTAYWALVTRMDKMIGDILQSLDTNGLTENTMVLYSSDHGEQVGEKALWMKRTFYEDSVRVPAILSWPGKLPAGQVCHRVIGSLDLNATMLDALQAPALSHSHGRSLLGLLQNEDPNWEDVAFSEYCLNEGHYHRMIRSGDWKLCYYHGQDSQLFNLAEDPEELQNRAADPGCQDVLVDLTARVLEGWDPEWVIRKMEEKRDNLDMIRNWVSETEPADQFRWEVTPGMNYLDP